MRYNTNRHRPLEIMPMPDAAFRAAFAFAHVDVARKRMVVTDGKALAVLPITNTQGDVSGTLSRRTLEAFEGDAQRIEAGADGADVPGVGVFERPKVAAPGIDAVEASAATATVEVCLDPDSLLRLANTLRNAEHGRGIRLRFNPDDRDSPIVVEPMQTSGPGSDARGFLMREMGP